MRVVGCALACWAGASCSGQVEPTCEYPESLGGGGVDGECGVTPGAWYPLGDSDLIEWPARAARGTSSDGLGPGEQPVVRIASDGRAVVGYNVRGEGSCSLRVQLWDGGGWQELGSLSDLDTQDAGAYLGQAGCRVDDLVFTPAGHILALIMRADQDIYPEDARVPQEVVVVDWDGSAWTKLGERVDWDAEWIWGIGMALDDDDRPVVAYYGGVQEAGTFRARAWTGTDWAPLGDRAFPMTVYLTDGVIDGASFVLDALGRPVLAVLDPWEGLGRYVTRWNGTAWEDLTDDAWPLPTLFECQPQRVVLDCQGRLVFTWLPGVPSALCAQVPLAADLPLHRLDDDDVWQAVPATEEELACIPDAARVAVYDYFGPGGLEVYLRRFTDGRWSGLSASDRGFGLSSSVAPSQNPRFAIEDGRVCVTWQEPSADGGPIILLRCHDLPGG